MSEERLGQLGQLSRGERLLIDRRRRGETQGQAAERHNTTHFMYGKCERDVVDGPAIKIAALRVFECCLLYRRRAGFTQAQVAGELNRCRWWVNQMERGEMPCDELVWYWEH